jgi:hypothetical protein
MQRYLTGVDIGILPPPPARSILSTQQLVAGLKIEKLQLTAELRRHPASTIVSNSSPGSIT